MNIARVQRLATEKLRERLGRFHAMAGAEPPDPKEVRRDYNRVVRSDDPPKAMESFVQKYGMERYVHEAVVHSRHPDRQEV